MLVHNVTVLKLEAVVSGHACDANLNIWEIRYKFSYPWDEGEDEIMLEKPMDPTALVRRGQWTKVSSPFWFGGTWKTSNS